MHLFSRSIRATFPAHFTLFDLIIQIIVGEEYKLLSPSICSFLQAPITSSLLNVRDQVTHPHRTTCKIIVVCILIFMFLDSRQEDKMFWAEL
jgi:hypothetical protein